MVERIVEKVLWFRSDLSPFLVHLTKNTSTDIDNTESNLESILTDKKLKYGNEAISAATYGLKVEEATINDYQRRFFSAVSFTETPLNEIHTMLDIAFRGVNLQPYGLVFLKDKLKAKEGVSPVMYINNMMGDKDPVVRALCSLIASHPNAAEKILPYISVFGKKFKSPNDEIDRGDMDFAWEREWRYVSYSTGEFSFDPEDVFIGLCPDSKIEHFEAKFENDFRLSVDGRCHNLRFIDPHKNIKWYADKLVDARQRVDLKYSVV